MTSQLVNLPVNTLGKPRRELMRPRTAAAAGFALALAFFTIPQLSPVTLSLPPRSTWKPAASMLHALGAQQLERPGLQLERAGLQLERAGLQLEPAGLQLERSDLPIKSGSMAAAQPEERGSTQTDTSIVMALEGAFDSGNFRPLPLGANGLSQVLEAVERGRLAPPTREDPLQAVASTTTRSIPSISPGDAQSAASGASGTKQGANRTKQGEEIRRDDGMETRREGWHIAARLLKMIPPTEAELTLISEMSRFSRQEGSGGVVTAHGERPPPPQWLSPPTREWPPLPSPPPPVPPLPPCAGSMESCLVQTVASVAVFDSLSRHHITPTEGQWPSADAVKRDAIIGGAATAPPGVRSHAQILTALWDEWEPRQEREIQVDRCVYSSSSESAMSSNDHQNQSYDEPEEKSGGAMDRASCERLLAGEAAREQAALRASAARLARLLSDGRSADAEARQLGEYMDYVLFPNTKGHQYASCWMRCEGRGGPCSWCGLNLCCRAGYPQNQHNRSEQDGCFGAGAPDVHRCMVSEPLRGNASLRREYAHALASADLFSSKDVQTPLQVLLRRQE